LISTRIRDHATRLVLPHPAENLDGLLGRAEADSMGYLDFVDLLLGEEVGLREGRRFRTALKLSGLPHHTGLDAFDSAFQPDLDPRKVRDLSALDFVTACDNIALLGRPGVGKTHPRRRASRSRPARPATRSTSPASTKPSSNCTPPEAAGRFAKKPPEAAGRFAKKLQTYLRRHPPRKIHHAVIVTARWASAAKNWRQVGPERRGAGSMAAASRTFHTVEAATG
jgi:hypothetical protein